jgi:hypothetical protein
MCRRLGRETTSDDQAGSRLHQNAPAAKGTDAESTLASAVKGSKRGVPLSTGMAIRLLRAPTHARLLASLAMLVILGLVTGGLAWGRPVVTWHLEPADNRLTIRLSAGDGPFAPWLLDSATVAAAGAHARRQVDLVVPAGRTVHVAAQISSLWTSTTRLAIRVPRKPALVSTTVTAFTETLWFTMPVMALETPCGLPEQVAALSQLVFPKGTTPCVGTIDVVARSGERARVSVSVPALATNVTNPPPPPTTAPTVTSAPAISFGPRDNGAIYITIDDGAYPDPAVLDLMRRTHVPITAFLISAVAAEHLDYWKAFAAAGGDIEDHTVSHPNLTTLSEPAAEQQWAGAAQAFTTWFGTTPSLGRPPYGAVDQAVQVAAAQAGLHTVVLWSASMYNGQLTTFDHGPLRSGEIVVLHWIPGLYNSLVDLLAMVSARGLHPASLIASLAQ